MNRCGVLRGSRIASLRLLGGRHATASLRRSTSSFTPAFCDPFGRQQNEHAGTSVEQQFQNPLKVLEEIEPVDELESDECLNQACSSEGQSLRSHEDGIEGNSGEASSQGVSQMSKDFESFLDEKDFPMSPFLNPEYFEAKSKQTKPKLRVSKNPTPFQKQLSKNAYALALATPVRRCEMSFTTLPSFFLQRFSLMDNPKSNEPWWIPGDLATKYRNNNTAMAQEDLKSVSAQSLESDDEYQLATKNGSHSVPASDASTTTDTAINCKSSRTVTSVDVYEPLQSPTWAAINHRKLGLGSWQLFRQDLIHGMTNSVYGPKPWTKPISKINALTPAGRNILSNAVWRPDMDSFVLELARRRAREALEDLTSLKRGYVAASSTWEQALLPKRQVAVILWTGPEIVDVSAEEGEEEDRVHGPPEFATADLNTSSFNSKLPYGQYRSCKVPVHNLRLLLGRSHVRTLRNASPIFNNELVILRDKRRVLDVLLKLWRLQGYVAGYGEFYTKEKIVEIIDKRVVRIRAENPGLVMPKHVQKERQKRAKMGREAKSKRINEED